MKREPDQPRDHVRACTAECSISCSSELHRGCDRNPRTGTETRARVLTSRGQDRHTGPVPSANEPRLQAGDQASGGARLGADASETEVGTEISTGGTTPTTSDTTRGD